MKARPFILPEEKMRGRVVNVIRIKIHQEYAAVHAGAFCYVMGQYTGSYWQSIQYIRAIHRSYLSLTYKYFWIIS